jgi:mRNA interferase HigB
MRIIKRAALIRFWDERHDAKVSLEAWYGVVRKAKWATPIEMKQVYGNADLVGRRTAFNVAGNKYRLIARVNYISQTVFVLHVLTHSDYDKGLGNYDHDDAGTGQKDVRTTARSGVASRDSHGRGV